MEWATIVPWVFFLAWVVLGLSLAYEAGVVTVVGVQRAASLRPRDARTAVVRTRDWMRDTVQGTGEAIGECVTGFLVWVIDCWPIYLAAALLGAALSRLL